MLEYFIYHYGTQIIAAILCAIFGCLGYAIKKLAVKYINDDTKRAIAHVAVQFVEQVWNTLHGADKLAKALETAEALLKKKGIDFDAEEMQILMRRLWLNSMNNMEHPPAFPKGRSGDSLRLAGNGRKEKRDRCRHQSLKRINTSFCATGTLYTCFSHFVNNFFNEFVVGTQNSIVSKIILV